MPTQNNFAASHGESPQPLRVVGETVLPSQGTSSSPLSPMAQAAAQERVSTSELAAALAAIETRRTTATQVEAGTITVGEAIEQLGLEIAPSEVLTEIRAQREQKADEKEARRKKRKRRWVTALFPLTLVGGLVPITAVFLGRGGAIQPAPADTTIAREETHVFNPQTLRVWDKNARTGGVVIKTLAEVPDNHPVTVDALDLLAQFPLEPKQDFVVSTDSVSQTASWTIIKHKGVSYLRGYVGAPMSASALASGEVVVCNRPHPPVGLPIGPNPSPITFRLDALRGTTDSMYQVSGGGSPTFSVSSDNWQRILLPNLKGDAFLWER